MKNNISIRTILFSAVSITLLHSCSNLKLKTEGRISKGIFPEGKKGPSTNFTGNAFNTGLIEPDSIYNTLVGNVYFEPGARSNWHLHPGGQILIILDGKGYHQIKDQPKQKLKKGDVVKCPPNVLHWHGASPDVGMQQMYIVPNTGKGIVDWKQAVTDEEYTGL
ncbi:cupin domain-containing protein [Pollutibacter soli]|uniref:cupin domain-containing protein n=1 Tax=Pollutibacter soli TaxID=3034157 RepID=UPI0030135EA1